MQKKIVEQNKTIQYIRSKYKEKTGEEIVMPKSWEEYLSLEQDQVPSYPLPISAQASSESTTLLLAIDRLNLPSRLSYTKLPLTSFSPSNKFHMIELIDLSGFKDRGFSKNTLRQLISRIVQMRCLKMINLSRNGIGEECTEQIEALLGIKRISRVDLSRNYLGKNCLQIISKNFNHLEWVEQILNRNSFQFEKVALQALLNAMRVNGKIYHMQMDWHDQKMAASFVALLKLKSHLRSLGPVCSKITVEAMGYIGQVLQTKQVKMDSYRLYNLNFDFCYLERNIFNMLLKSLSFNNTLIRLILSNNHLGDDSVCALMRLLESNISIVEVDVSGNLLEDQFAVGLAQCLNKNQIIEVVDISKNNIGIEGGRQILKSLGENNDTVQSLGAFQTNARFGPQLIQKIKRALRINRVSKDVRSKILNEQPDLSVAEVTNKQTEAFLESEFLDYELLEPISVTNPIREDAFMLNIWKFG